MPDRAWLVESLIPEQSFVMLYGPSSAGKSFLALDLMCSLAVGTPWLEQEIKIPGKTLYVAAEGVYTLRSRLDAWEMDYGETIDPGWLMFYDEPIQLSGGVPQFLGYIKKLGKTPPSLIVLDTLARCSSGVDENSKKEMGPVIDGIDLLIRETHATVLLIHHSALPNPQTGEIHPRGHSSLANAADVIFELDRTGFRTSSFCCIKQKYDQEVPPRQQGWLLKWIPVGESIVIRRRKNNQQQRQEQRQRERDDFNP